VQRLSHNGRAQGRESDKLIVRFPSSFAVQQRFAFRQKQPVGLSLVYDKSRLAGRDPQADIASQTDFLVVSYD
jgi:hypothetical protein